MILENISNISRILGGPAFYVSAAVALQRTSIQSPHSLLETLVDFFDANVVIFARKGAKYVERPLLAPFAQT